jgi:hypothetical protein
MRLIHYLNENEDIEDIESKIRKDCKPWLNASAGHYIYRGMYSVIKAYISLDLLLLCLYHFQQYSNLHLHSNNLFYTVCKFVN